MPHSDPSDHYLADRVQTASPAQLTIMLFDALVLSIRTTVNKLQAGERVEALPKLQKAQAILIELRCTLDPAASLAPHLDGLYDFAWRRLLLASGNGSHKLAQEALDVVEPLRDAFRQAASAPVA